MLPVVAPLAGLLPAGGLRRGTTVAVAAGRGPRRCCWPCSPRRRRSGAWAGIVGPPGPGVGRRGRGGDAAGAAGAGAPPRARPAGGHVGPARRAGRRGVWRAERAGCVPPTGSGSRPGPGSGARCCSPIGPWPGADVELTCADAQWQRGRAAGERAAGGARGSQVRVLGRGLAPAGRVERLPMPSRPASPVGWAAPASRPGGHGSARRSPVAPAAGSRRRARSRSAGCSGADRRLISRMTCADADGVAQQPAIMAQAARRRSGAGAPRPCGCWRCGRPTGRSPRPRGPPASRRTGRPRCSWPTGCWRARRWPGRRASGGACAAGRPRPAAPTWPCSPPTPIATPARSSRSLPRSRSWRRGWRSSGRGWWRWRRRARSAGSAGSWTRPSGWSTRSPPAPVWSARSGSPTACSPRCSPPAAGWPSRRATPPPSSPRSRSKSSTASPTSTDPSWSTCCAGWGCAASGAFAALDAERTSHPGSAPTPCSATASPAVSTPARRCAGVPPEELTVELELDPPVDRVDAAAFAARGLAERLHAPGRARAGLHAARGGGADGRRGGAAPRSGGAPSRSPPPARSTGSAGSSTPGSPGPAPLGRGRPGARGAGCGWCRRRRSPRAHCSWGCGARSERPTSAPAARWCGCRRCWARSRWSPRSWAAVATRPSGSGWCHGATTGVSPSLLRVRPPCAEKVATTTVSAHDRRRPRQATARALQTAMSPRSLSRARRHTTDIPLTTRWACSRISRTPPRRAGR